MGINLGTHHTAEHLEEIKSLKFMITSLESTVSSSQEASHEASLKESEIASLWIRIREFENELERTVQMVSLKNSDISSLEVKLKESENERKKSRQNDILKVV